MTTEYTFVSEVAARLFAEWWNNKWATPVQTEVATVRLKVEDTSPLVEYFYCAKEAFNAAAQHASEIAKEGR